MNTPARSAASIALRRSSPMSTGRSFTNTIAMRSPRPRLLAGPLFEVLGRHLGRPGLDGDPAALGVRALLVGPQPVPVKLLGYHDVAPVDQHAELLVLRLPVLHDRLAA